MAQCVKIQEIDFDSINIGDVVWADYSAEIRSGSTYYQCKINAITYVGGDKYLEYEYLKALDMAGKEDPTKIGGKFSFGPVTKNPKRRFFKSISFAVAGVSMSTCVVKNRAKPPNPCVCGMSAVGIRPFEIGHSHWCDVYHDKKNPYT